MTDRYLADNRLAASSSVISDLTWHRGFAAASWNFDGHKIEKKYGYPVTSACQLRDGSGVALVEPINETGPNNAIVFNADGAARFRVQLPFPTYQVQGFAYMYYVNEELTAIIITPGCDFAVVVDERTGEAIRTYETR